MQPACWESFPFSRADAASASACSRRGSFSNLTGPGILGYIFSTYRVKAKIAVAGKLVATLAVAAAFSFKTGGLLMAIFKGVTIGVALVRRMVAVTPMLQVAGITSGNPSFYD